MSCIVFYSWQSDLPNKTNRGFIEKALENAAKSICLDESIEVEPVIDRDTAGVPGTPDIAETILRKVEQSQVFVCDVSITNESDPSRPTPNPNVLIELGYALKTVGASRIIMVMNTVFGGPELLPFDLRMKRVVTYAMAEEAEDRATERRKLEAVLTKGLRTILEDIELQLESLASEGGAQAPEAWDREWLAKHRTEAKTRLDEREFPGYMEVRFALSDLVLDVSQKELLDAAKQAQIHTFGWPIGVVLDSPEHKPRPRADGIVAEVDIEEIPWGIRNKNSYDYWALRDDGDFFLLKSIFEDERLANAETDVISFNTRIVRITEVFLYCERLYSRLGVKPSIQVHIGIKHSGLDNRTLTAVGSRSLYRARVSTEDEVEHISEIALGDIEVNLANLVKEFARPLFMVFEFQEFSDSTYDQIVNAYLEGNVT